MENDFSERVLVDIEYERSRVTPPEGFPELPDIQGGRYTDTEFLDLETELLWKKSWLYACHSDELPESGSYILWRKTGSPIIILRDTTDQIRAFYNTCRHRGGPLVREATGTINNLLVCGYHGWSYDLRGNLVTVSEERDFMGLEKSCRGLIAVRCERLGNWVFINEDMNAEALNDYLSPIPQLIEQFQPENLHLVDSRSYDIACNTKVMLEAFLEVYHVPSIHPDTVNRFLDNSGCSIMLWPKGHSLMATPNKREDWIDPGTIGMPEISTVTEFAAKNNLSFNFFPNLIAPMAPTGIPFLTFWPTGYQSMRVETHWFAPEGITDELRSQWEIRLSNFERILEEDILFAPRIQESIESTGFKGIKVGYQERRIYHWHEELDRRIGLERVPQHLRVKPMLEEYIEKSV